MNMLRTEWAKLKEMDFTEKRQYIWEYYKLHIIALLFVTIMTGSLLNTLIFNPPRQDYLYFVWIGPPVTSFVLEDFANEFDIIVEDPERYIVRATNYTLESLDPQMMMALQTRFVAQMQMGGLDLFMLTRYELYVYSSIGFVLPIMTFLDAIGEISPAVHSILGERLVEIAFYVDDYSEILTDYMAASMRGVPFFDKFDIRTDDLYMAVVINSDRFERAVRALELIFDV